MDGSRKQKTVSIFAWLSVLVVAILGYVLWLVPISWYGIREWIYPIIAVPLIGYALFTAFKSKSWVLGICAILALLSPIIWLTAGFFVFGF